MHTMDNRIKTLFLIFLGVNLGMLFFSSCGGRKKSSLPPKAKASPLVSEEQKVEDVEKETQEKPVYVYSGDRFRDPFVEVGQTTVYQPDAIFNPDQAKLKAVIYSRRLRSALLNVSGGGSYFVKGGRIFDIMGKTMTGFKAKIFPEKVVISGEEDDVFELKLRESEDDEEESDL